MQLVVISGADGPMREPFSALGAQVKIVPTSTLFAASSRAALQRRIEEIAQDFREQPCDAVVANTLLSFWGVQLAQFLRIPSLLYIHESTNPAVFFRDRIQPLLLPSVYTAFNQATAVSFNTAATAAYYRPYVSGDNFRFTPAWIERAEIDAFRAAHSVSELRKHLQLESGERLVANIGTVCDRKGQHDFLRAIEWLWRLQPDLASRCRFVMVGGRDTPYNRSVEETIAVMGRKNVHLVPETSRPYDYFGAAELFVCTSYEESFPRVVLEAMAFEVPIVTTEVQGVPSMLHAGEDALLVNPGDVHALALAMRRALEEPALTQARAQNARKRVAEFDAARVMPLHAALIAEVAGASS